MNTMVDDKKTIWNRPIPLRPFFLIATAIIVPPLLWLTAGDRVSDWIWYAQHHGMANYEGTLIKLPFPWRQEDTLAGLHELSIRRASRTFGLVDESMLINKRPASPKGVLERIERFRDVLLATRPSRQTTVEAYHPDAFIDANYDCIVSRTPVPSAVDLYCTSVDGRWNLFLTWGKEASLTDAMTILHALPLEGKANGS
jgi:hypothetical protein